MTADIDIAGVFVPTLMVLGLICYGLYRLINRGMARAGLYRFVWHPALFDIALYFALLGASVYLLEQVTP